MSDFRKDFALAMAQASMAIEGLPIDDGQIHRFHINGDKPGSRNGWYVLYSDGIPTGVFGSWRTSITSTWCARSFHTLSASERQQHLLRMEQARQQRENEQHERQQRTATFAADLWKRGCDADSGHPYLICKGIYPHNIRQAGNILLIPMIDSSGKLWNLQRIHPNGDKLFLTDGRTKGCFCLLGELVPGRIFVCEGYATGVTIHQQSGLPVACAMNAGNLLQVCQTLKQAGYEIIIAADNDHGAPDNPGLTKAQEAAFATGAGMTWPEPCGPDCSCTDFNDIANCAREVSTYE